MILCGGGDIVCLRCLSMSAIKLDFPLPVGPAHTNVNGCSRGGQDIYNNKQNNYFKHFIFFNSECNNI